MSKMMMNNELSMEELEQVNGGNIFTDAMDWVCEKVNEITPFAPIIPQHKFDDFPIAGARWKERLHGAR